MEKENQTKPHYFNMKKIIYIAHPIGGDVESNVAKVLAIVREISIQNEVIPFAPYIVDVLALEDSNPVQRQIGFSHNEALFRSGIIDEVWLYGGRISYGMQQEIEWAKEFNILVKQMWDNHLCEEYYKDAMATQKCQVQC